MLGLQLLILAAQEDDHLVLGGLAPLHNLNIEAVAVKFSALVHHELVEGHERSGFPVRVVHRRRNVLFFGGLEDAGELPFELRDGRGGVNKTVTGWIRGECQFRGVLLQMQGWIRDI